MEYIFYLLNHNTWERAIFAAIVVNNYVRLFTLLTRVSPKEVLSLQVRNVYGNLFRMESYFKGIVMLRIMTSRTLLPNLRPLTLYKTMDVHYLCLIMLCYVETYNVSIKVFMQFLYIIYRYGSGNEILKPFTIRICDG